MYRGQTGRVRKRQLDKQVGKQTEKKKIQKNRQIDRLAGGLIDNDPP